jgi:hypothetical protein
VDVPRHLRTSGTGQDRFFFVRHVAPQFRFAAPCITSRSRSPKSESALLSPPLPLGLRSWQ